MRRLVLLLAIALSAAACSSSGDNASTPTADGKVPIPDLVGEARRFPAPPSVPDGPMAATISDDLDLVMTALDSGDDDVTRARLAAIERIGTAGDPRALWPLVDLLRFFRPSSVTAAVREAFEAIADVSIAEPAWGEATDHLIAWDIPAPEGYVDWKRVPFEIIEPAWAPFFDDAGADIDFRILSWGGVLIDDRPLDVAAAGLACPRGCIPALDDPVVTEATGGDWYPDAALVFGVVVNGEARAYPKNIMEVHEMVNDTLGGREIGMPYCTLCGSAQAYFTDDPPTGFDTLELRTSGLLQRSNKFMYELHTFSGFDTFTGRAVSGPLREAGVALEQITVRTSTWADWKTAHPDTTIVAEDGGIGREYDLDPLGGRDDDGPIFPIGQVDSRLPVQEPVIGVLGADGAPVAFPVRVIEAVLANGDPVELGGITVTTDGAGFEAFDAEGDSLTAHQSFWFAWSQFNPDTLLFEVALG